MVYTINLFRDLILTAENSWECLEKFLTSAEGGKLLINKSACGRYAIIHYDQTQSIMTMPHVQWFRSVVWDIQKMRPISVAPPKAQSSITEADIGTFRGIQEYLDGTNINIYCGENDEQLQLASRSSFGAKGRFYSKKSFAELFVDALGKSDDAVKAVFNLNECKPTDGEVSRFISVLLQHPEHRIVQNITEPRIWLLHIGIVRHDGTVIINEDICNIPTLPAALPDEPVQTWFDRIAATRNWEWRGAVFKDGSGKRWCMKNQVYQFVRDLRGNTPRITELFFTLRSRNMTLTYLSYYPEDLQEFTRLEQWTCGLVTKLHKLYINVYKLKTSTIEDVNASESHFVTHLRLINKMFHDKRFVDESHVRYYVGIMPVARLMFLLRATSTPAVADTPTASSATASHVSIDNL
jgi:hypothetical protein